MSAFLSSSDTISALATYWADATMATHCVTPSSELARAIGCSAMATGSEWPSGADLKAAKLINLAGGNAGQAAFELLLAENVASLQARYPYAPEMWAGTEEYRFKPSRMARQWLINRQTGPLVGLLRGYRYQACEHAAWQTSVAFFITAQISDRLLGDLESRDCSNDQRLWASWTEPTLPGSGPILLTDLLS